MPRIQTYSGHMICRGCCVETALSASRLCASCEQDWQCKDCGASMVWNQAEWCGQCHGMRPFKYHLTPTPLLPSQRRTS